MKKTTGIFLRYKQTEDTDPKDIFLNENVFYGLKNLNDGFDASVIKYFNEEDFRIVLQRVEKLGLGVCGIEPWQDGEYFDCNVCELVGAEAIDPKWYNEAFDEFVATGEELQYAASYYVPKELLKF